MPDLLQQSNLRSGDLVLGRVWERQGFDGAPQVVSRDEFDALPDDHVRLFRGIANRDQARAQEMAEQYRSGTAYPGFGGFGNGTYAATGQQTAVDYATGRGATGNDGAQLRMALRPDANIIDYDDVVSTAEQRGNSLDETGQQFIFKEPGTLAAAMGYDAVRIPLGASGEVWYVVMNRTSVIVEEAQA